MLLIPPKLPPERAFKAPGTHLCGMAWDGTNLWHSDADTQRIYRLDRETGDVLAEIPCPDVRTDLAWDGRSFWQIVGHPKRIRVLDPTDRRMVQDIELGSDSENACGLHVGPDRYWIGWKEEATIEERDVRNHNVIANYPALTRIAGLTERNGALWFTDFEEGLLVAVQRSSGQEVARFQLEGNPTGLCWDGMWFWYSDYLGRRICAVRIPDTEQNDKRLAAGPGLEPGLAHSKCAGLPLSRPRSSR